MVHSLVIAAMPYSYRLLAVGDSPQSYMVHGLGISGVWNKYLFSEKKISENIDFVPSSLNGQKVNVSWVHEQGILWKGKAINIFISLKKAIPLVKHKRIFKLLFKFSKFINLRETETAR